MRKVADVEAGCGMRKLEARFVFGQPRHITARSRDFRIVPRQLIRKSKRGA